MTVGWWAESFADVALSVPPRFGFASAPLIAASVGLRVPPTLSVEASDVTSSGEFALSVPPRLGMSSPVDAAATITVPPHISFAGAEEVSASFGLRLPPRLSVAGAEAYTRSFGLRVPPKLSFAGVGVGSVDYSAVSTKYSGNASSFTLSITAAAGDYVLFGLSTWGGATTASSVTYGGAAMSPIATVYNNNVSTNGPLLIYGIKDTTGGAKTIAVTLSTTRWVIASAASYAGVGSVGEPITTYGNTNSLSSGAITRGAGQRLVSFFGATKANTSVTFGAFAGGTRRFIGDVLGAAFSIGDATADTTFTTSTTAANPVLWSSAVIPLNP